MRSEGLNLIMRCELKRRARAGIDFNTREFAERHSTVMQDCGAGRLRMGNDGDALARMGFRQVRKAAEHAALKLAHGLSSRRAAGLPVGIPALPMAIVLQLLECTAAPGAKIRLVEFRHDFDRLAERRADRLGRLPRAELGARLDVCNAAPDQYGGETLCLPHPGCAQGNIRLSSDQNAIDEIMVTMADEDDRGRHGSMVPGAPAIAIDKLNRSRPGFAVGELARRRFHEVA
jgi:hypothetical protein